MARFYIIVNLILILSLTSHAASTRNESNDKEDGCGEDQEVCPENEEFWNCTQNICRELTCKQRGKPLACNNKKNVKPKSCRSGCVCKTGYLRTAKRKCVPENQCYGKLVCKDGEIVNTCPNFRFDDHCPRSQKEAQLSSKVVSGPCSKQHICTCGFNYKRAKNGTCIPTRSCPPFKCSGKYEEYNACPPICPSGDCSQATPNGKCPLGRIGIILPCRPSCRCISGYYRNNGVCVPYAECPGKCPTNEEFSTCAQAICRAENCTQRGKPIACPSILEGFCEERCVCVQGTLRNASGFCVPEDQCPTPTCGKNEFFNTCPGGCATVNCPKSFRDEQDFLARCVSPAVCFPAECTCLRDYRRDSNGECIYIGECPGICPDNEEFSNSTDSTSGNNKRGCVCKEGFSRNEQGNCVEDQIPSPTCGKNEFFNTCPGRCATVKCPKSFKDEQDFLARCVSPAVCFPVECTCLQDYRRDSDGECIYIGECPGICPDNEEFSNSTDSSSGNNRRGRGCVCKEGFSRNEEGDCVPDDCSERVKCSREMEARLFVFISCSIVLCAGYSAPPQPQCGKNEELSCVNECPPERTCRTRNIQFRCKEPTKKCEEKCVCKDDFYRNPLGDCISDKQCDQCDKPNEFFTCGPECDNNCTTLATQNRTNCPIQNIMCNKKCYCEDGFARDAEENCIPVEKCPKSKTSKTCNDPNEEYFECKITCPPDVCFSMIAFYDCSDDPPCEPGCTCKPGYYRKHWNTTCIHSCECPQMYDADHCKKRRENAANEQNN